MIRNWVRLLVIGTTALRRCSHGQRAMLDFAWKLTTEPWTVDEP